MGQKIAVKTYKTVERSIFRFELDRSLSGMGYERYSFDQLDQYLNISKVSANLAVRLLQKFPLKSVDIFSNEVIVEFISQRSGLNIDENVEGIANDISNFPTVY